MCQAAGCILLVLFITVRSDNSSKLRFHPKYDPRQQRASLLRLDDFSEDKPNKTSYSYLLSIGTDDTFSNIFRNISNSSKSKRPKTEPIISVPDYKDAIDKVEDVVSSVSERDGFTSLTQQPQNDSIHFPAPAEIENVRAEPRIPPPTSHPSSVSLRRTSPADIVGFSAIRASGFSRAGDSRIYFENTVTDTNYGWDSFNSIFITHYPGLYFFTFSVKADADYKVSLIKNGEEVVSVGGAVDKSLKNVGTSASNSVILNLEKDDRVWLQLVRGGLVETLNKKTGYSSFSGYKLGCLRHSDRPSDFTSVSLEDVAQSLDEESLENLDEKKQNNIDRDGNKSPYSSYPDRYNSDRWPSNPERPNVYKDKHIFDAFNYNSDSGRGQLRPAHRPFHGNGPAIIDKEYVSRPSSDQDDFSDFFAGDENRNSWNDDRLGDRRPDNRWSTDRDDHRDNLLDKNRYNQDKTQGDRRPDNRYNQANGYRDRRPDGSLDNERYNNHGGERYRDRYHVNTERVKDDREENLDSASTAAMFFKRRQAMNHHGGKNSQETHLSYGK